MFRLLVVEDEPWIRKSLEKILPWEELGIEYAGSARNGEEAFEKIVHARIDLILTDIKMPKMDGFALMDKLGEHLHSPPKYMIISGYEDFHYAKSAIKQGVVDYILKPVDPLELKASILKTVQKLNSEKAEQDSLWKLRLKDYVYERINDPNAETNDDLLPDQARCRLLFSVRSIHQELARHIGADELTCFFPLPLGACHVYFFMDESAEKLDTPLTRAAEELRRNHIVGLSTIRTGRDVSLYEMLKEAEYDYLVDDRRTAGLNSPTLGNVALTNKDEVSILKALQDRDKAGALQEIKRLEGGCDYFEQRWTVYFQLYLFFGKYVSNAHSGLPDRMLSLHELKNVKTNEELELWRQKALEPMMDEMIKTGQGSAPNYFLIAAQYIDEHFANASLSLESVARHLQISTPYLSGIFNRMGENYTSYVTRKRVDQAKRLLLESELTVYEISESVGFNDVKYFIHVFKKETLCTPNGYRKLEKLKG